MVTDHPEELAEAAAAAHRIRRSVAPDELASSVYRIVYARRWNGTPPMPRYRRAGTDRAFVESLVMGLDRKVISSGWTLEGATEGQLLASQDGLRVSIPSDAIARRRGNEVAVSVPAVQPGRIAGAVTRLGIIQPSEPMSRCYLAIGPHQARWTLERLCDLLDDRSVPYIAKVLASPYQYGRADAAVVYVGADDENRVLELTIQLLAKDRVKFRSVSPLLTKVVTRGVAVADDPDDVPLAEQLKRAPSHGEWVTSLFTRALESNRRPEEVAEGILRYIEADGRDTAAPYRRRG